MRKNKRWMILVVMFVLTWSMLTSCGQDSDNKTGGDSALGEQYGAIFASFSAKDVDGNTQNQQLVTENQLTLVVVWATYCSPCVEGLPLLEEIYQENRDKGFGILGIVADMQDQSGEYVSENADLAKTILEEKNATFPNVEIPLAIREMLYNELQYTPTAFFVNQDGVIVSDLIIGEQEASFWNEQIKAYLEK